MNKIVSIFLSAIFIIAFNNCASECEKGEKRDCYTGADKTKNVGDCSTGEQTCTAEEIWGSCNNEILPSTERCDGYDNNCNGSVDEGCDCVAGKTKSCFGDARLKEGVGECKSGVTVCGSDGKWGECLGDILPKKELCDTKDNNCDGAIDNLSENVTKFGPVNFFKNCPNVDPCCSVSYATLTNPIYKHHLNLKSTFGATPASGKVSVSLYYTGYAQTTYSSFKISMTATYLSGAKQTRNLEFTVPRVTGCSDYRPYAQWNEDFIYTSSDVIVSVEASVVSPGDYSILFEKFVITTTGICP